MAENIETKVVRIKDASNGTFDIALKNFPQAEPEEGVTQIRANVIQIRNARNGDFDLVIPEDHTIEDALIQNTQMDEYINDRVTTIGNISQRQYAFGATQIKKISFPNATACPSQYAFHGQNISLLEELYLPKLESCGYGFAENNPNLRIVDFGKCFGAARCRSCPNLEVLIIRDTSTKEVGNMWLTGCTKLLPDGSGGIVYVPQSLLASYQASTAWATYANVLEFRAIEGSQYEIVE